MRTTSTTAAVLIACVSTYAHAEVTVQPIALQIGSPAIEAMDFGLRPNGINAGTSVHLLVSGFEQPIVKLDDDNSTLGKAVDSTGKDLLEQRPQEGNRFSFSSGPIGPFPKVSNDGGQLIVEFIAPQAPAPGATGITYEGSLSVLVAAGKKTASAKGVALKPGKVQLGDQTMQIAGFGPSDWEEGKFKLTVKLSTALLDTIASWKVLGPDGQELSDGPNSTMTMMNSAELELTLESSPPTVDIELELYDGLKTVAVPIRAQVGLGFE
jgi:hypothetical protein